VSAANSHSFRKTTLGIRQRPLLQKSSKKIHTKNLDEKLTFYNIQNGFETIGIKWDTKRRSCYKPLSKFILNEF
jgi:hypothetical protein